LNFEPLLALEAILLIMCRVTPYHEGDAWHKNGWSSIELSIASENDVRHFEN